MTAVRPVAIAERNGGSPPVDEASRSQEPADPPRALALPERAATRAARPLHIALVIRLLPYKLGSLEDWMCALAAEATGRGHRLDVFSYAPVHPAVARRLAEAGAGWYACETLTRAPLRAARRLGRNYDVVLLNLVQPRDSLALISYAGWPARVLMIDGSSMHGPLPRRSWFRRLLDRLTLARIAGIAGVSNFVTARNAQRYGRGTPQLRTIHNGVDETRFRPQCARADDGQFRLLAISFLIPGKGIDVLLRALAEANIANARLTVAGEGPELPTLVQLAEGLGLADRVEFVGLRDDVERLLADADAFVHPCRWEEAFGLVIAEAQAAGKPVIASATGGIPEIVTHDVNGVLIPPDDVPALASALRRLADDPEERRRLGTAASVAVRERFRLADCVRAYVDWCEEAALGKQHTGLSRLAR